LRLKFHETDQASADIPLKLQVLGVRGDAPTRRLTLQRYHPARARRRDRENPDA
jgi:hypothetical protein